MIELDVSITKDMIIRAGETLCIPATVTGKPYPYVNWTKDDRNPDKDLVQITTEGNKSILSLPNIQRKDAGKYQISAANPSGIKNAWTRVEVVGKSRKSGQG